MFSLLIDLVKNVVDIAQKNKTINIQHKENISKILIEISNVLTDTALKLRNNEYPHMNCAILERLSSNLQFYASDIISLDELNILRAALLEASQIEKQFALRNEPDTIPGIEKAAGEFRAMAIIINM